MNRLNSSVRLDRFRELYLGSANQLLSDQEPLTRLAGRVALLGQPDLRLRINAKLQLQSVAETHWQGDADGDQVNNLIVKQRLDRHLKIGRTVGELAVYARLFELTQDYETELLMTYTPQSGTHFFQRRGAIEQGTDLPYLSSEVATVKRFIDNVESGLLQTIPKRQN